jgi:hypothetical protein
MLFGGAANENQALQINKDITCSRGYAYFTLLSRSIVRARVYAGKDGISDGNAYC